MTGTHRPVREQVASLERVLSASGVPALQTRARSLSEDVHLLQWAWSEAKDAADDLSVAQSPDDDLVVVLDGYVTRVGRFALPSDGRRYEAAHLLRLWQAHGHGLLPELDGSFTLVVIRPGERKAEVFSDRIASRSVWYAREAGAWYVGNFASALYALLRERPRLDPAGLWALLWSSRHVGRKGLYHGILNLQGGQYLRLEAGEGKPAETGRWHRHQYLPEHGRSAREWGALIAEELRETGAGLRAHTPALYLFLSGGMDSRIAAAAAGADLRTVTLTSTRNNMNVRVAEGVARRVGARHETVERTPYWYLDTFNAAALVSGGSYNLGHAHFMVPVEKILGAEPEAAFMLGDMLENFNKHYFKKQPQDGLSFVPERLPDQYPTIYSYTHPDVNQLRAFFQPHVVKALEESWREELVSLAGDVREVSEDPRDCLDTLFRWNNCSLCPTYLMMECIRPMAADRNLMFSNRMLDLLHRIPADVRGAGKLHTWTLWHLDKGLALIPNSNYWLPPVAPQAIKEMTKRVRPYIGKLRRGISQRSNGGSPVVKTEGSWHMRSEWYRKDEAHRRFIEECLTDEACFPSEIFDRTAIQRTWQRFLEGPVDRVGLFGVDMLLSFGLVHRLLPSGGLAL